MNLYYVITISVENDNFHIMVLQNNFTLNYLKSNYTKQDQISLESLISQGNERTKLTLTSGE